MATRPSSDQACRHGERSREESVIFLIQVDRRSRHSLVSLHPSLLQRRHEVHSLSSCLAPMKEKPGKSRTSAPTSQSRHQHPPTSELRVTLEKTPQDLLKPRLVDFSATCSQMHPGKPRGARTQSQPVEPSSLGSPPGSSPFQLATLRRSLPVTMPHLRNGTDHSLPLRELV